MSHQPNPQQPGWNAQGAPQQPAWGPPRPPAPQPPKKNQAGKIIGLVCLGVVALFIVAGIIGTLTGAGDDDKDTASKPASSMPALTDEQRASIAAAAGLPPDPDAATRKAYLAALTAIDPRIPKPGKDDQTVDRGLNQCAAIKRAPDDRDKLIQQTLDRFTISTRLPDISTPETGGKVLDAVHKHLCPDF
ncbi:hypothetical protein [Streptomyces sp. bgisy153]|uniref:hypothetical protein n=1 Tax=Streptomyces sp. bgisy153 TaxID=3413793 RepID=UPI003D72196E